MNTSTTTKILPEEAILLDKLLEATPEKSAEVERYLASVPDFQTHPSTQYDPEIFGAFQKKLFQQTKLPSKEEVVIATQKLINKKDLDLEDFKAGGSMALSGIIVSLLQEAVNRPDEFTNEHLRATTELIATRNQMRTNEYKALENLYQTFLQKNMDRLNQS